jgi:hypothetical protein
LFVTPNTQIFVLYFRLALFCFVCLFVTPNTQIFVLYFRLVLFVCLFVCYS